MTISDEKPGIYRNLDAFLHALTQQRTLIVAPLPLTYTVKRNRQHHPVIPRLKICSECLPYNPSQKNTQFPAHLVFYPMYERLHFGCVIPARHDFIKMNLS